MGMFDTVISHYKGIGNHIEFQTKSLSKSLEQYRITYDGQLEIKIVFEIEEGTGEYSSYYAPCKITKTVNLYGTIPNTGRAIEFEIDFIEGYVSYARRIV